MLHDGQHGGSRPHGLRPTDAPILLVGVLMSWGERLAAWIGAYDFFAASAGAEFRTEFMEQAAVQAAWLRRRIDAAPPGPGRFAALAGLAAAAAGPGRK